MIPIIKISIIIPVYNAGDYLGKCLDSVINQTYKNLEIILINDGSTDKSGDICNKYAEKDSRMKVVHKKNTGVSDTRNIGINQSTGKYILFLDCDDWLDTDTCFIAIQNAEKYNADLIFWSYIREYENSSIPKKVIKTKKKVLVFEEEDVHYYLQRRVVGLVNEELRSPEDMDSLVTCWAKLYRAAVIKNNDVFFEDMKKVGTEDMLFNLIAFKFVKRAIYINKEFYHYRKDNISSLTHTFDYELFSKWKNLFEIVESYLIKNKLESCFYEALNNRICLSFIGLGMIVVRDENISVKEKYNKLNEILNDSVYSNELKNLSLKNFDIKWKVFFYFTKKKTISPLYYMLRIAVHSTSR